MTTAQHAPHADKSPDKGIQAKRMERYYRFHAAIYDATRWAFLFGRDRALDEIARLAPPASRILEVGCGTGRNLRGLHRRLPGAQLFGVDISSSMLRRAGHAVRRLGASVLLHKAAYGSDHLSAQVDTILFSYCLTMVNPGWQQLILQAKKDLAKAGRIVVVDFHDTPSHAFRRWMGYNHVQMNGEILDFLHRHFSLIEFEVRPVFFGLWRYFVYVGTVEVGTMPATDDDALRLDPEALFL